MQMDTQRAVCGRRALHPLQGQRKVLHFGREADGFAAAAAHDTSCRSSLLRDSMTADVNSFVTSAEGRPSMSRT